MFGQLRAAAPAAPAPGLSVRLVVPGAIVLAWPAFALAQGGQAMRFVCLGADHRPVASEPLFVTSARQAWAQLEQLAENAPLAHCWSWNNDCAVTRVLPGEDPAGGCRVDRRLRLRVVSPRARAESATRDVPGVRRTPSPRARGESAAPAGNVDAARAIGDSTRSAVPAGGAGQSRVTAAPVDMWREVPLSLLPTVAPDPSGSTAVPRSEGPWRVHARMGEELSARREVLPEQDAVELVLKPSFRLAVQVTADHAPLARARLTLVRPARGLYRPEEPLVFEQADDSGRVALTVPEQDRSLVIVAGRGRRAVSFRRPREAPATVELHEGFVVRGRAVNDSGEPVAAARVIGSSWIPGNARLLQRQEGESAPDGSFRLSGFPPGAASLQAESDELRFSRVLDLEGSVDLGRVMLTEPKVLWIRVVDRLRQLPIGQAKVRSEDSGWMPVDDDGLVRLPLLQGREIFAEAGGYHYEQLTLPGDVGANADEPFVVALVPVLLVEGRFFAADGRTPAAGGRVTARRETDDGGDTAFGQMAPDGAFRIELEAGSWELQLSSGNAGTLRLDVAGSAGETLDLGDLTAPASAWVSGFVVDPEVRPLSRAVVSHTPPYASGPLMAWALGQTDSVETNEEGYFELFGLAPGVSVLRVEADGFAPLEFEVRADGMERLDAGTVEMSRGRRVTVRSDVEGGVIVIDTGGVGHPRDRITAELLDRRAAVDTVPDGSFHLTVLDRGVPVCQRDELREEGDVDVRCDRSTTIVSGRVAVGGRPGDGILLWRQRGRAELPEGVIRTVGGLPRTQPITNRPQERDATLDTEGRYRMDDVLPGVWDVIWMPLEGGMQEVREVTVPDASGEEFVLNLDYSGASIEGVVAGPGGEPAAHATIDVFPGRRAVVADAGGRFQVLGLSPGAWQLRARWRGQRSALVDVRLRTHADRQTAQLTLTDEPPNEELEIRMDGGDRGFCFLETDTGVSHVIRVDSATARRKLAPPLAERVRIACRTDGRYVLGGWRNLRRALDQGVDLDARESDTAITLVGDAPGVSVEITGPGGWDLGRLRIWFGGARTFRVKESIANLPEGTYTVRWNDRTTFVRTERRRAAEVEIVD